MSFEDAYVGMRVLAHDDYVTDYLMVGRGATGTICILGSFGGIGVAWDREYPACHNCNGQCKIGHGWFVCESDIDALQDVELPDIAPDADLDILLRDEVRL